MAHYRGTIQGGRGEASRLGHKSTGIHSTVASWSGAVKVRVWYDESAGVDRFGIRHSADPQRLTPLLVDLE